MHTTYWLVNGHLTIQGSAPEAGTSNHENVSF